MLDEILQATRKRVAGEKSAAALAELRAKCRKMPLPRDFVGALAADGIHVIAEVKTASPSAGPIGRGLDPLQVAADYARNGATAISVLTEPFFFDGDLARLACVRSRVDLPLLMKDFVIDDFQIAQGRACGADCVLLIIAVLGREGLREMLAVAHSFGLAALVEVHSDEEMEIAIGENARLIGVNTRDLRTLAIDAETAVRLAALGRRSKAVLIYESGVATRRQIDDAAALGYRGFLIGSHLISSGEPGRALARLLGREPQT